MHELLELRAQSLERTSTIAVLAALLAGYGSQAGGHVYQPDTAFRRVLVLPARSARTKSLHLALGQQQLVRLGNFHFCAGLIVHCEASLRVWHDFDERGSVWRAESAAFPLSPC